MESPQATNVAPPVSYWHRITPFSRYTALALFLILPFAGFWLGLRFDEISPAVSPLDEVLLPVATLPAVTSSTASSTAMQTYRNDVYGFSLQVPAEWKIEAGVLTSPDYSIVPMEGDESSDEIESGMQVVVLDVDTADYAEDLRNEKAYLDFAAGLYGDMSGGATVQYLMVAGTPAVLATTYLSTQVGERELAGYFTKVHIWHDGGPVEFEINHAGSPKSIARLNNILRSFTFTE